jgi:hypothetical protein
LVKWLECMRTLCGFLYKGKRPTKKIKFNLEGYHFIVIIMLRKLPNIHLKQGKNVISTFITIYLHIYSRKFIFPVDHILYKNLVPEKTEFWKT